MNDKCIHIANITGGKWYVQHEQSNRVYSDEGISPTVCTRYDEGMIGFKIMTSDLKKELCNELIEKDMVKEGDMIYHSYTNNRLNGVRDINTVQNKDNSIGATLTTRPDTLGIVVDDSVKLVGGVGAMQSNNGRQFYQQDRIYDSENIALCQSANESFNPWYKTNLRIRKLTPRETWRLMGFDDEDFDKAEKVNSNAQLYKQAGNSIVVNVLEAIFREML